MLSLPIITNFLTLALILRTLFSVAPELPEGYEDELGFHYGSPVLIPVVE